MWQRRRHVDVGWHSDHSPPCPETCGPGSMSAPGGASAAMPQSAPHGQGGGMGWQTTLTGRPGVFIAVVLLLFLTARTDVQQPERALVHSSRDVNAKGQPPGGKGAVLKEQARCPHVHTTSAACVSLRGWEPPVCVVVSLRCSSYWTCPLPTNGLRCVVKGQFAGASRVQ